MSHPITGDAKPIANLHGAEPHGGRWQGNEELDGLRPFDLPDFAEASVPNEEPQPETDRDRDVDLQIVLGRARMHLEDVLKLRKGAVVPLDSLAGDLVDIFADGRLIGRGEVVVLADRLGIRIAELVTESGLAAA